MPQDKKVSPTQEIFLYLYAKIPFEEPRKAKYRPEVSKSIEVTKKNGICILISYLVFTEDTDLILALLTSNGEIHPTSQAQGTSKGRSSAALQESRAATHVICPHPRTSPMFHNVLMVQPQASEK